MNDASKQIEDLVFKILSLTDHLDHAIDSCLQTKDIPDAQIGDAKALLTALRQESAFELGIFHIAKRFCRAIRAEYNGEVHRYQVPDEHAGCGYSEESHVTHRGYRLEPLNETLQRFVHFRTAIANLKAATRIAGELTA